MIKGLIMKYMIVVRLKIKYKIYSDEFECDMYMYIIFLFNKW